MAKVTPEEFAEKHARRLKGALTDIRSGVEKVSESPTKKAAQKIDKMRQHLLEKFDDGTIKARLQKVSLEEWRSKMINKGLARISGGIDSAHDKVVDFASQLLPAVDAARAKVQGMPDLTLEDSIARMETFIREMAKFRKK